MRSAFTRAVLARPTTTALASTIPRTAFLPSSSLRFSSTESTPSTAPTQTPQAKPYSVARTNSGSLPVYKTTKAAGSSKFTVVKKVQGNRKALADDIAARLAVPRDEVTINPVTGHVRVKGDHHAAVKLFLDSALGGDVTKPKQAETTA